MKRNKQVKLIVSLLLSITLILGNFTMIFANEPPKWIDAATGKKYYASGLKELINDIRQAEDKSTFYELTDDGYINLKEKVSAEDKAIINALVEAEVDLNDKDAVLEFVVENIEEINKAINEAVENLDKKSYEDLIEELKVVEVSAITTKIKNEPNQQLEYKLYGENGKEIAELPEGYSVKFLYTIDGVNDESNEATKGIVNGSIDPWKDGFEYQVVVTPEEGDPIKSDWTKVEVVDPKVVVEVTAVGIFYDGVEVPAVNLGDKGLVFKATKGINAFGDEVEDLNSVEVISAKSSDVTIAYYDDKEGLVLRKEGTVTFEIKFEFKDNDETKDIEKTFKLDVEIKAGQKLTSVVAEDQKVAIGEVTLEAELLDQFDNPMKAPISNEAVVVKILNADEEEVEVNELDVSTAGKLEIKVTFEEEGTYTVNIYANDGKTLLGTFSVEAVDVTGEPDDYDLVLAEDYDEAVLDINEKANAKKVLELIIKGYVKGLEVQPEQFSKKLDVKTSNKEVATAEIDEEDNSKVIVTLAEKPKVGTITVTLFIKEGAKETPVATIDVEVVNTTPQVLDLVLKEGVKAVVLKEDAIDDDDAIKEAVVNAVEATFNEDAPEDTKFNVEMFDVEYVKANGEVIVIIKDEYGGKEFTFPVKIVEPEPEPDPEIIATYHPSFIPTFGFVTVQVNNLEGAAKFSVVYHLSDDPDGTPNISETGIVDIDQQAGLIFYDPKQYNTVDIKIFDAEENLIYVFVDVVLETGNQTSMMNYSKISSIIVGDEVFDIDYLNKNSQAQAKLIEYINAGNEVYIKFENNVVVNLKGEAVK